MLGYVVSKSLISCSRISPSSGEACQPEKTTVPLTDAGSQPVVALVVGLPLPPGVLVLPAGDDGAALPPPPPHAAATNIAASAAVSVFRRIVSSSAAPNGRLT